MTVRSAARAYSLLEVVLAAAICASALVPALAVLRDGAIVAATIDKRHLLLVFGVSKMEEQMADVAANWSTVPANGDFANDGHANIRFATTKSDSPASGGMTDQLMSITVTTYSDDDADDTLDATEMRTTLSTKIAKLLSYENKASN